LEIVECLSYRFDLAVGRKHRTLLEWQWEPSRE